MNQKNHMDKRKSKLAAEGTKTDHDSDIGTLSERSTVTIASIAHINEQNFESIPQSFFPGGAIHA
jgi:hypothetical protein